MILNCWIKLAVDERWVSSVLADWLFADCHSSFGDTLSVFLPDIGFVSGLAFNISNSFFVFCFVIFFVIIFIVIIGNERQNNYKFKLNRVHVQLPTWVNYSTMSSARCHRGYAIKWGENKTLSSQILILFHKATWCIFIATQPHAIVSSNLFSSTDSCFSSVLALKTWPHVIAPRRPRACVLDGYDTVAIGNETQR